MIDFARLLKSAGIALAVLVVAALICTIIILMISFFNEVALLVVVCVFLFALLVCAAYTQLP